MRIFHVNIYEGVVTTGQTVYSSPSLSELFGTVDRLYVGGYATPSQISPSPTLTIQEEISVDGENWGGGSLLLNGFPLNSSPETIFQGSDDDPDVYTFGVKAPFRRINITVGGSGSAVIHVWATGRDRARGARPMARTG